MFLAVTVRDYEAEPAVEAVEEVLEVTDGETGEVLIEGVPGVPAKDAVVKTQVSQVSIEPNAGSVAQNLAAGRNVKYYKINAKPGSCTIKPVTLKAQRSPAPAKEVVEVVADGVVVGFAEV